ncbi:MAG: chemotaxis protein CheD [Deltaproteobacteria bacterium]|nr:chemotaxis protein CheD [Deltaproteobacteria bacterium]
MSKLRRPEIDLHVGEVRASREAVVLRTVLGSCVAVCLYDARAGIGGMNHFALPACGSASSGSARFGSDAMPQLLAALAALGADCGRVVAKLFGGAQLLELPLRNDIARRNISYALHFLAAAKIIVVASDCGGHYARHLRFEPDTGRARVARVNPERAAHWPPAAASLRDGG